MDQNFFPRNVGFALLPSFENVKDALKDWQFKISERGKGRSLAIENFYFEMPFSPIISLDKSPCCI